MARISYKDRYNLLEDRNPFSRSVLDCIASQDDHGAFLRSGCYQTLVTARDVVAAAAKNERPCFVLVTGGDGTGRTSVANCLLHEYLLACQTKPHNPASHGLLRVPLKSANARQRLCLLTWLADFKAATQSNRQMPRQDLPDPVGLRNLIRPEDNDEDIPELLSTDVEGLVRDAVTTRQCAVGTIADKVRYPEHIRCLYVMLRRAPALTVFTGTDIDELGAKLKSVFDSCKDDGVITHTISLGAASGEMIGALVKLWWEIAAQPGHAEPPLHPDGVAEGFDSPEAPIGRALYILGFMIDELLDEPGKTYNKTKTADRIRDIRELGMKLK